MSLCKRKRAPVLAMPLLLLLSGPKLITRILFIRTERRLLRMKIRADFVALGNSLL